jgi:hypothetical protein
MFRLAPSLPHLVPVALFLAGCASPPAPYRTETFDAESPYVNWSTREPGAACELGKRALLSQGYQVESANPASIRGEKFFQPKPSYGVTLHITLVCLPSNVGAVMYANALQTRFELKSASSSTGVSVAGVGSISLPWASDKEAMVKVGEETISDPAFYRRLFALIEAMHGEGSQAAQAAAKPT